MKFRYESLLQYRVFVEESKMSELAEATEKLDIEEKRLFTLEEIRRQAYEELKQKQERNLAPHELVLYQMYLQQIKIEIESQQKRVMETQVLYDEKKESLIIATQEKKIIEKVKSKDKAIMRDAEKRAEKKVLDETGNIRYVRENC
ncbi:MAG: flagellar export protein FliJ [Nitrospirae bacterium]|nr:flagellar export protein FliJ [Nitrospirota bacterium]